MHKEVIYNNFPSLFNHVERSQQRNELKFETSGASLEKIKKFLYGDTIGQINNETELMEIEDFARKNNFHDLAKYCNDQADQFVTVENCLNSLCKYQNPTTLNACINVIIMNFMEVCKRAEFIKIPAASFETILKSDQLVATENDIFLVFLKWYHELPTFTFEMDSLTCLNRIDADIIRVLAQIRFPLISLDVSNSRQKKFVLKTLIDILFFIYSKIDFS